MFGPLFQLHWLGVLCPCLQKDEDRNARQALTYVNATGKRILWMRTSSGTSGGFLGGLFRKNSNDSSSSSSAGPSLAKLSLQDNSNGIPEVVIDPTAVIPLGGGAATDEDTQDGTSSTSSHKQQQQQQQQQQRPSSASSSFKLNLKLHRIDKVTLEGENDIVLRARRPVNKSSSDSGNSAKELLRFRVLNSNDDCPIKSEERNMFVHHMAVLVEWERQRRATNPDEFYDDDDDEDEANQPNFLQARATKAAHFAKRELELQQTRRDREKRKAKLVQETGGLKYTALALAKS